MYCSSTGQKFNLRFWKLSEEENKANASVVFAELDKADYIIGYNVVLFDLEYIKLTFGVSEEQMTRWVKKSIDPFMCAKYILKSTCKLNDMLALNNLTSKTGSGSDAIILAQEGKWQELMDYCIMDVILTWQLTSAEQIVFSDSLKGSWKKNEKGAVMWTFFFVGCTKKKHSFSSVFQPCNVLPTNVATMMADCYGDDAL